MNPVVTSKEAILQSCRKILAEQGLSALSMRAVSGQLGIALGTLYNYFSDKDALMLATVESVWKDIFHGNAACRTPGPVQTRLSPGAFTATSPSPFWAG